MGIEQSYVLSDPNSDDYKPTIAPPGHYYCYRFPECKGSQVINVTVWDSNGNPIGKELKPCPKCGALIMYRW